MTLATREISEPGPLSPSQRRFYFLDRLVPGSPLYNISAHFLLEGPLDEQALSLALQRLVARHPSLRTSFALHEGRPRQRVSAHVAFAVERVELSSLSAEEAERESERIAAFEARRPFELDAAPLLRVRLVCLGPARHALLLTVHHIVADGWSLGILQRELGQLYAAACAGRELELPTLPGSYADVAAHLTHPLDSAERATALGHWVRALGGAPAVHALPTDHPRPPVQSLRAARVTRRFAPKLVTAARSLARRLGVTPFSVWLAAYAALLSRASGQTDFVLGTPVAGRSRLEHEGLVGPFVNTLALRLRVQDEPRFAELARAVHDVVVGGLRHGDVPFEEVVDAVTPERSLAHSPLFQLLFHLDNAPTTPLTLEGLVVLPLPAESGVLEQDLALRLSEDPEGLLITARFALDLFEPETIGRLLARFEVLLEAAVREPHEAVSRLPWMPTAELSVVMAARGVPPPEGPPLPALFVAQAERTPATVALVCGEERVTYAELERRSRALAEALVGRGVGRESVVAFALPRVASLVVTLLGILRAGAAYLPLAPDLPAERAERMALDAGAHLLVTDGGSPLAEVLALETLVLSNGEPPGAAPGASPLQESPDADALAYVLFTSGSTGRPKGVEITHRALAHFAMATRERLGLTSEDTIVAVTSPSFDIAVLELLLPLTVGGRTVLATERQCGDGRALAALLDAARPTVFQATPATYRLLVRAGWKGHAGLRVLCGGEALDSALAAELIPCGAALWNLYGPTETTVWSSAQRVAFAEPKIPIGEPLGDTVLVVLDTHLEPVPPGIPGELCIGGAGLARGYRGSPELTAERFVDWVTPDGEPLRLYRTGDIARFRPDGPIELLGRADAQIKLRGHRIELGEIEAVLRDQDGVTDAAVLLVDAGSENARLVAFVVGRGALEPTRLRGELARQLPAPMLPAAIKLLPTLPLTRHGKVDRSALLLGAAPDASAPVVEQASESPLERTLLDHMRAILGEPSLGRHESFFERGGHSLLAMELFVRLELALGRTLPLAALFEAPSASGLARVLAEPSREVVDAEVVLIEPGAPDKPAFFCVHGALGGVLGYRTLARHVGPGRRFFGIQADLFGMRPGAAPTLEALAGQYVALVRRAQPEGPYSVGGYSFGGLVAFEMARQLRAAGAEVGLVALLDTAAPRASVRATGRERLLRLMRSGRPGPLIARSAEALGIVARGAAGRLVGLGRLVSFALRDPREEGRPLKELAERRDRAMARAAELYRGFTVAPYAGRVVLFRARSDGDPASPDDLGWRPFAPDLAVVVIPGKHQSLLESPQVEVLGRALGRVLCELAPRGSP